MRAMQLEHIKMTISALWVVIALVIAVVFRPSMMGTIFVGALGLLPPLLLMLLWNDPAQTMSESIDEARR
jgi:hypothetical protein